jgi:hypothetical protein
MAARLPLGQHVLAENSNHWIMQEEPDLVVHAVEQVAKYSEKGQSPAATLVSLAKHTCHKPPGE